MNFLPQAKDPAPSDMQQKREESAALDLQIRTVLSGTRELGWELAKACYEFEEISGWHAMDCDSRNEWLASPEIGMRYQTYMRLVRCYRGTVVERKVDFSSMKRIDPSKVDIVLPALNSGRVTLDDALGDAEALAQRDLREKYIGPQLPAPADDPAYDDGYQEQDAADDDGEGAHVGIVVDDEPVTVADMEEDEEVDITKLDVRLQAHRDWNALEEELLGAAESGQKNPRIDHRKIRVGLWGHEVIVAEARLGLGDDS